MLHSEKTPVKNIPLKFWPLHCRFAEEMLVTRDEGIKVTPKEDWIRFSKARRVTRIAIQANLARGLRNNK